MSIERLPEIRKLSSVKDKVVELFRLERDYKRTTDYYKERKHFLTSGIKNFMYANARAYGGFDFLAHSKSGGDSVFEVKKVEPTKIIYDAQKLSDALPEGIRGDVIKKKYIISDYPGLVKYLSSCGVAPAVFKKFITLEKSVNEDALQKLFDLGEITAEELKGCYEIKKSSSYLKIKMKDAE